MRPRCPNRKFQLVSSNPSIFGKNGVTKVLNISLRIRLLGLAVVSAAVLASTSQLAHAQELRTVAPHRHGPASIRHVHDGTSDSDNWAGYAVAATTAMSATPVSVTYVSGSWVVPAVTCSKQSSAEYASFWVGIDGWYSSTVEQIGTDSDCSKGKTSYYAWYEFYPEDAYYAGELTNLTPGDQMSATVTYNVNGTFTATITDEQQPSLEFTTTFTPSHKTGTPQRSSAEWITEQTGKLADFGTVFFGDVYTHVSDTCFATATVNGQTSTGAIGSFPSANVWSSTMVNEKNGNPMATPSALMKDDNQSLSSFYVDWNSVGP